jgi:ketosteroid isomerase-like protein
MRPDDDIQQVIERTRAAVNQLMDGGPDAWLAVCSERSDATLFGDSGGHARGWEQLETQYRRASARHAGADVSFEEITRFASGALAYTVWIERAQAQTIGTAETSSIALRVTHIYRREDGDWKLVHRHADPLVSGLNATTIIQRQPN